MGRDGNADLIEGVRDRDVATQTPLSVGGAGKGMTRIPLYPLRFEPIFTTNLWGGRRLPAFLNRSVAHNDPIGEAWILSDVDGSVSRVSDGPLALCSYI